MMLLPELLLAASIECPHGGLPFDLVVALQHNRGNALVELVDVPPPAAIDQVAIFRNAAGAVLIMVLDKGCADDRAFRASNAPAAEI